MSIEITLVRHGETTANAAGVWQGHTNSGFSAAGREQVKWLAERLAPERFDLVVTSDLGRAAATAGALGVDYETDVRWRELQLGSWEGMTAEEIEEQDGAVAAAVLAGEDIALGGGERISELVGRLSSGLDDLVDRLEDGSSALVVSHGGALLALFSSIFGGRMDDRLVRLTNTAVSRIEIDRHGTTVRVYNDSTHLPGSPLRVPRGSTELIMVRHGQTEANLDGRWQGHQDGRLTPEGREQARLLASVFPQVDAFYSSPLTRARDTAAALADRQFADVQTDPGLCEIGFGSWEGLTVSEIRKIDQAGFDDLVAGIDGPRGGNGETFHQVASRVNDSVERIAADHPGTVTAAVSHGGATRAYATGVLGLDFALRHRLGLLANTAMARVVYGPRGPTLGAWNLTPHLAPR
jgi:broad specificity phosphatase PhoE